MFMWCHRKQSLLIVYTSNVEDMIDTHNIMHILVAIRI